MKVITRTRALACLALAALLSQPARADDASKCKLSVIAKLPVQMEGERASLAVTVNGQPTRIWLDSGAFFSFMPKARAVELGLPIEPFPRSLIIHGIGGSADAQLTKVREFGVLGAKFHNVPFLVGGSDSGNGFLGANFLGVFDTEFDLAKGAVNLFNVRGCGDVNLAYWGTGMLIGSARLLSGKYDGDHHIFIEVFLNGHALRAGLDTGAPTSIINRSAAIRAGIDMKAPQVLSSIKMGGIGTRGRQTWIARMGVFSIGGVEIKNSPIHIIDDSKDDFDADMLLGVDFLMAHHLLVAQSQHTVYLTYNGGPIFSASTDRETGHLETRAEDMGGPEKAADPKTADEFAGRGSARLLRNDTSGAIADFSEAIRLAPGRADLLTARARAYTRAGKPELSAKDIDAALVINPADHRLLTRRAQIRLGKGDKVGALADTDAAAAATPKGSLDIMPVVVLYERMGRADRGLTLLDAVIDLHRDDSSYATLLNARSWNRALANADLDRALRDVTTAIRKSDGAPAMLDTRAWVQFRRKDYAATIADATAGLAKAPKMAASLYVRGMARLASGDAPGAQTDLAAARAITPTIDQYYAAYGLAAPKAQLFIPAQPAKPDGDDDDDQ